MAINRAAAQQLGLTIPAEYAENVRP